MLKKLFAKKKEKAETNFLVIVADDPGDTIHNKRGRGTPNHGEVAAA